MKYSVDIEAGNAFVERLKVKAPKIGGFNGMVRVPSGYEKPVLVSGTDGVGTKINLARIASDYTTIGIDGETAEHYRQSEYDLAGFCTGIVEENEIVDGSLIKPGDKVIGFPSSGLHSNGYSLINDMLWRHNIFYKEMPELLTPTTIYAPLIERLMDEIPILGMAHITGGGIPGNLPRCLPQGLKVDVNYNAWTLPEVFQKIMLAGEILEDDMITTFNMGIGFCIVVPAEIELNEGCIIGTVEKV